MAAAVDGGSGRRVVVWQADGAPTPGTTYGDPLARRLLAAGLDVAVVPLPRRRPRPEELAAPLHVLSGGTTAADSPASWMRETRRLLGPVVDRALDGRAAVLGVCLGSQLLATLLAGNGAAGPAPPGMQAGLHRVRPTPGPDGSGERAWTVAEFHHHDVDADRLTAAGARITLTDGHSPVQGWQAGVGVTGYQFHPEFDPDLVAAAIRNHESLLRVTGADPELALATVRRRRHRWDPTVFDRLVLDRLTTLAPVAPTTPTTPTVPTAPTARRDPVARPARRATLRPAA